MDLATIADRLEIDDLLTRYAVAIDRREWDVLDTVFAAGAHLDYRGACGIEGTYPDMKAWFASVLPMFEATQHLVMNREISIDGDAASVRSQFLNPNRIVINGEARIFTTGGYYHDRLERRPEGWRIVERIEESLWWENPMPGLPAVPPGLAEGVVVPR